MRICFFFLGLTLLLFTSCIEEPAKKLEIPQPNSKLALVKNWFEKHKNDLHIGESRDNYRTESNELILPFFEKEPDWDKFHIFQFPDGREVYEISLANTEFIFYDLSSEEIETTNSTIVFIQNIMFIENKENGRFDPLIVRYFPNDESSKREFNEISYQNIGNGWTGKIDIWTYDERHFIGFNVENGVLKTTSKLTALTSDSSKLNISGHNLLTVDCVSKPRIVTHTYCQKTPRDGSCSHTGTYTEIAGTEVICWPSGGTTGEYAGGSYSFEGGGGGSNTTNSGSTDFWNNYQPPNIPEPGLVTPNQMIYSVLSTVEKSWWDNFASDNFKSNLESFLYSPSGDYDFAWELVILASSENETQYVYNLSKMAIETKKSGYFSNHLNTGYVDLISPSLINVGPSSLRLVYLQYLAAEMAVLRKEHPNWSDLKIYWNASRESLHWLLDLAGMVPVIGEIADLTNATIYSLNGDPLNATLSASSAIPFVGWFTTGNKYAIKAIDLSSKSKTVLKWIVKQDGNIIFGSRNQLRKVLGIVSSSQHAHHLIPWELANHPLVQKAAKSKDAFHMNEFVNGFPLPSIGHFNEHNLYNQKIGEKLDLINSQSPTNDIAFQNLTAFIDDLRQLIRNNPSMNIGQISNLIN